MKYFLHRILFALSAIFLPSIAEAHIGTGEIHGFMQGLTHPFYGLDHLCAMVAVGLWATQIGGRTKWLLPFSFVGMMEFGSILGLYGIPVPYIEEGIALSLLVLGLLLAASVRLPLLVSVSMVSSFAVFHGYAHGAEMPLDASGLEYAAGFSLATALLHTIGIALASLAQRHGRERWLNIAGVGIVMGGGFLFA